MRVKRAAVNAIPTPAQHKAPAWFRLKRLGADVRGFRTIYCPSAKTAQEQHGALLRQTLAPRRRSRRDARAIDDVTVADVK